MTHPLRACQSCGSDKVFLGVELIHMDADTIVCGACGFMASVGDLEWDCPHCEEVPDEALPSRTCSYCQLLVSEDYPSSKLAFLWKAGSHIRRLMEKDAPAFLPHRRIGQYLRTKCGPHCWKADTCPQSLEDIRSCANADQKRLETGSNVQNPPAGNVSSRHTHVYPGMLNGCDPYNHYQCPAKTTSSKFAKGGWLSNNITNETYRQ